MITILLNQKKEKDSQKTYDWNTILDSLTHPLTSGEHLQISESIIGKMQSNLYTSALYSGRPPSVKRPVFKAPIFRSYKHCMFKEKNW